MWLRIHTILLLLVGILSVRSQNLPDNIVVADCTTDAVEQPWDAQVLHSVNDIHCYYVPIVGDIDGDGIVEIVAGKAVTNDHYTTQLGIYKGTTLQQLGTISIPQRIYAGFTGPTAIVRYPDGNGGMRDAAGQSDGVYYYAIEYHCVVNGGKKREINMSITVVR